MKNSLLLSGVLLLAACTPAADDMNGMDHGDQSSSQDASLSRLVDSPRHHEWVEVERDGQTIHTWVVYPETEGPAPVVVLIHENRGLNDWARSMADQVAEAGYIAVAPDLLSGYSEQYARTSDFPNEDAARTAISDLNMEETMADIHAVAEWAETIPASDGTLVSAGFCWGGARSYQFATMNQELDAALVFYGTGPEDADAYANISAPVFGFYGGADERVNATIDESEMRMEEEGKTYDYVIYDGAGHAFMRTGEDPNADPANIAARNAAFERMKQILSEL